MPVQNYERYWSITNAYTDYNGNNFLTVLKICIDFIDKYNQEKYSEEKYSRLQSIIQHKLRINLISIRKAINQLVKMGFINSFLVSYNADSIEYLNARTNRKRNSLLSKIIYSFSSFNRSINNDSELHQINFLIKTLVENGRLTKSDIIALMLVDIQNVKKGYLDRSEIDYYVREANKIGFIKRKYNQVGYLFNLLGKLDDLVFVQNELYFQEDAKRIFGNDLNDDRRLRDPYLHRLYKNQLEEESESNLGSTKCMVEKLTYPVLIASHIKPFIRSNDNEAYDANNGLLLSKNLDSLFDLGYISFTDSGKIIISQSLSTDVKKHILGWNLDKIFINEKRIQYLNYHRDHIFNKRFTAL